MYNRESSLTDDVVRLDLLEVGKGRTADYFFHTKTVPFAIVTQATSGRYEVDTPPGTVTIRQGEAFLSRAGTPLTFHHYPSEETKQPMSFRYVHCQFSLFETIDLLSLYEIPQRVSTVLGEQIGQWIEALWELDRNPSSADPIRRIVLRKEIGYRILNAILAESTPRPEMALLLSTSHEFKRLLAYVHQHMNDQITIEALTQELQMSRSRLFLFFRQAFRQTPLNYLKAVRLNEAFRILSMSDSSIHSVAEQVGFSNPYHFSREFKRKYGISPSEFRKSQKRWTVEFT